ncbi:MAG: SRPBCC family protein [Verrucomicrobiae bacterium]|nr:SRPBCC family protein [Verrucomicrobiae bacterium]
MTDIHEKRVEGVRSDKGDHAAPGNGVKLDTLVTVGRPVQEVYHFWRDLKNLPQFMPHLKAVEELSGRRSHWVARGPARTSIEWDADIIADVPNKLISWRSIDGSNVENAGSVSFRPIAPQSTEVRVQLTYNPPAGELGRLIADWFGETPEEQIGRDLENFRRMLETGEMRIQGNIDRPMPGQVNP